MLKNETGMMSSSETNGSQPHKSEENGSDDGEREESLPLNLFNLMSELINEVTELVAVDIDLKGTRFSTYKLFILLAYECNYLTVSAGRLFSSPQILLDDAAIITEALHQETADTPPSGFHSRIIWFSCPLPCGKYYYLFPVAEDDDEQDAEGAGVLDQHTAYQHPRKASFSGPLYLGVLHQGTGQQSLTQIGSPYAHLFLMVQAKLPEDYPRTLIYYADSAPELWFTPSIYHPNISWDTGKVCIDVIKESWLPGNTLATVMNTVNAMLMTPNPDSPLNGEAAKLYRKQVNENSREYLEKARSEAQKKNGFKPPQWYI